MNRKNVIGSTSEANLAEKETKPNRKARPGLDDPYEHAPPKPDGDLWAILLKPEMEADRIRCDAWKEEVQNLLIFAGLFSAVVTAFVIESYKFLRPDPNDTIIMLLSQIANGPNTTSTSMATSFVQAPSSIRINVFWFISLILSLTTVLVGTIALQWLREHQSYPAFSPKETLAILHMRTKALEAWYVPQIFAVLPLLLQSALVLFLAGLIDFTLPLGMKLAVPIACIIGLILLFLGATTALPAFQPLFLHSGYFSRDTVPTPCAFKSPQSQVFRTLGGFFLRVLSFVLPSIYRTKNDISPYRNTIPEESGQSHLFPHIYTIWHRKTWPTFDAEWLSLRDAWHHGILDKDTELYRHRHKWRGTFPLSDITQCLVETTTGPTSAKHTEEYLVAACYCFQEISMSVWNGANLYYNRIDRRNNYFEQIYLRHRPDVCSVPKFLLHGGQYKYEALLKDTCAPLYFPNHKTLFFLDQVCLFLDLLTTNRTPMAVIQRYQLEIKSRVIPYLLMSHIKPWVPTLSINPSIILPVFDGFDSQHQTEFTKLLDSVDLLAVTFKTVTSDSFKENNRLTNPVYNNKRVMPRVIDILVGGIIFNLHSTAGTRDLHSTDPGQQDLHSIGGKYSSIFQSLATHLTDEITSKMPTPSLLFELSAMLLQRFSYHFQFSKYEIGIISRIKDNGFGQGLSALLDAVARYKQQMDRRNNHCGQIRFEGKETTRVRKAGGIELTERFSLKWWDILFLYYDESGLRNTKTCPAVPSSAPLDIIPQPLTSASDGTHAPVPNTAPSSPSATSLHIRSESATTIVISSPTLPAPHIPNAILGALPLGQAVEGSTGADAQLMLPSTSQSELPIPADDPPDNPTTPDDPVIDIRPPTTR